MYESLYRADIVEAEGYWMAVISWGQELVVRTHGYNQRETAEHRGLALLASYESYYRQTGQRHELFHHHASGKKKDVAASS